MNLVNEGCLKYKSNVEEKTLCQIKTYVDLVVVMSLT